MSDFDPVKALKEEITGMAEVARVVAMQTRESEAQLAEAETKHNAMLKLDAFMKSHLTAMREELRALEIEIERRAAAWEGKQQ